MATNFTLYGIMNTNRYKTRANNDYIEIMKENVRNFNVWRYLK